jgi:hypothetical protein
MDALLSCPRTDDLMLMAALQKFFPELLWPTKERKARKKYRNKEKVGC